MESRFLINQFTPVAVSFQIDAIGPIGPEVGFKAGEVVPGREQWRLYRKAARDA